MKRTLICLLAIAYIYTFAFIFTACDSKSDQNADSSQADHQIWLPYTMLDYFENCKYTYYYDEYGNEIKTTKADSSGTIEAAWLSEYDDNHNLIKRSVDTGDGELFVQLIQTYDDKGNLIEKRETSTNFESVSTYRYDEQNRLISRSNNGQIVETYTYEADGSYKIQNANSPDEYSVYGADGKIQERHLDSDIKLVYFYNDVGILVECATYSEENITKKTVYHLDDNGNAVKISQVNAFGNEKVTAEYEYTLYTVKAK